MHAPVAGDLIWRFRTGNWVDASPTFAFGVVFIASQDGYLYAIDTISGDLLWRYLATGPLFGTPVVVGSAIYTTSLDGHVYALNSGTGQEIWRFNTGDRVWASPVVESGIVYVGSDNNYLYAIDAATGAKVWEYATAGDLPGAVAVYGDTVYLGSYDEHLYALDKNTGTLKFKTEIVSATITTPAVYGGLVITGDWDGYVYAFSATTGEFRWGYRTDGPVLSSPTTYGDLVVIGSDDGYVYAFDVSTGRLVWRAKAGGPVRTKPLLAGGLLYFGSQDGHLYAVDRANGETAWTYRTGGEVRSAPAYGRDTVYLGSRDRHVYALKAGMPATFESSGAPAAPSARPPFTPLGPEEVRKRLDFILSTNISTIGDSTVVFREEIEAIKEDFRDGVLEVYETGYYLLTGRTPQQDGWIPTILSRQEYYDTVDARSNGEIELKQAMAYCCYRSVEGLELVVNGDATQASVLASLAHESGHARQRIRNPVQDKSLRETAAGAIREAEAYAFEAALIRRLGEYSGVNATLIPTDSTASQVFDTWRAIWRSSLEDPSQEHARGIIILWLAVLNDPLLADAKAELIARDTLSPETILTVHDRLIRLAPNEAEGYLASISASVNDDFNLIGGILERRKGDVPLSGFVVQAVDVFATP
ncbi:MAG: hypothetical protein FJ319_03320 [SAR202 cluster bacterium]|nr:hypothetical protein [SAR202 cluster bacterium]